MKIQIRADEKVTMTSGDFNNDGNPDLIIGIGSWKDGNYAERLHFYEGDGKGNFKLRQYTNN